MGLLDDVVSAAKGAMLEGAEGGAQGILNNVLQGSSLGGLFGVLDQQRVQARPAHSETISLRKLRVSSAPGLAKSNAAEDSSLGRVD